MELLLRGGGGGSRGHARVEIGGERRERHFAEACEQQRLGVLKAGVERGVDRLLDEAAGRLGAVAHRHQAGAADCVVNVAHRDVGEGVRSEEHTAELPYLMRTSYAVFCLKQKKNNT